MQTRPLDREFTDAVVTLRRPAPSDRDSLIDGRDDEYRRFIGEGSLDPNPTAVVLNADRRVVGWLDYDVERDWLGEGEVNIGYAVFPADRGNGIARRALALFLEFLAELHEVTTATLLIDPANVPSIAVARSTEFARHGQIGDQLLFKRALRVADE